MRTPLPFYRDQPGTRAILRLLAVAVLIGLLASCNASVGDRNLGQQSQALSGGGGGSAATGGSCCLRSVMAEAVPRPAGQTDPVHFLLESAFHEPHAPCTIDIIDAEGREAWLALCAAIGKAGGDPPDPVAEKIYNDRLDLDYWIRGTVTVDQVTGTVERWYSDVLEDWFGPNPEGSFTLHMEIYDPHHEQVVTQGRMSWSGTINSREGIAAVESLSRSLGPLSAIFHDYERRPIQAIVEPEFDPVLAGEEITLRLTEIRGDGGRPQPWWRIFVKARQGEITNGEPEEEWHWFKVGEGAPVEVLYRAPEACYSDEITEEITVKNTCNMTEHYVGTPQDDIANTEFQVLCTSYALEYDNHYTFDFGPATYELTVTGRVPFRVVRNAAGAEDPFRLQGGGQLQHSMVGTFPPGCTMTMTSTQEVTVSGAPRIEAGSVASLMISLDHAGAVGTGGTVACPGGVSAPVPAYRNPDEEVSPTTIEMEPEDGFTLEGAPAAPVEGTWRFVLHQPGP